MRSQQYARAFAAPAAARSVVALVDVGALPADVVALGGEAAAVLPDRFRG